MSPNSDSILRIAGRDYRVEDEFEYASSLDRLTYVADTTLIPPKKHLRPWKKDTYQKGLFAEVDIPKGDLIGAYEGVVVTSDHIHDLKMPHHFFIHTNDLIEDLRGEEEEYNKLNYVGVLGRNNLRFANHQVASDSNMKLGKDFMFFAKKDIAEGEELSWCYGPMYDNQMNIVIPSVNQVSRPS